MKIVAGLGCVSDYPDFIKAGADEVFAGYVPFDYIQGFGRFKPLNRREVVNYNVQLGAGSELEILADMIKKLGGSCSITVNAPVYTPKEIAYIKGFLHKLHALGFTDYIIASERLLNEVKDMCRIHVSGEYGELNRGVIKHLSDYKPKRIIFPRQTTIEEMKMLIETADSSVHEFEAFVLNEKCHFTGAYCSSRHCDELCHMCKVPYRLEGNFETENDTIENSDKPGSTGCGICALWDLRAIGVTHLKLVSRGNAGDQTIEDIKLIKQALDILDNSDSREEYITNMKHLLFPNGCSGNCYYS